MPNIDVSEVLNDPDFLDQFDVIRRAENIGDNGRGALTPQEIPGVWGVVVPEKPKEIWRRPDGSLPSGAICVISTFALRNNASDFQADVVIWNRNHYIVMFTEDWSRFGHGFIKATCFLEDTQPVTPVIPNG